MGKSLITQLTALVKTPFLGLFDVTYKNKLGQEKHWMVASRKKEEVLRALYLEGEPDRVDAVVVVAYHEEEQKLVIIRQFRVPINDYIYELPAGLIDPMEEREVTLRRELKEETGLDLVHLIEGLSVEKTYLSPGLTDESVAFMYCTCRGELSRSYLEEDEEIEALLISQEEAKKLLEEKVKMDIKLIIILRSFVHLGKQMFQETF
ncbi:DNA mismatch repair protein MutT [Sporanaerobium hydrogeniformans]|uniref:DNA mismatch repair protein MutT n=1 Tax=Sporanaerobium hydrogeniformans TaxID=3072179 RepID=A0AC61DHL3_9FIRM|nr:NUDIX hydrolase [Sporanaerobium hydrogeniformans]PHV71992.1 DNA mismatch repair protein MutT [Sporanaerobium hydrogeniformans]